MNGIRGFSIVEAAAATAILALAVLAAVTVSARGPLAADRIAATWAATEAAENVLEGVRSGALPLSSGLVRSEEDVARSSGRPDVTLTVKRAATANLYEVQAEARVVVHGKTIARRLTTMVWRPK